MHFFHFTIVQCLFTLEIVFALKSEAKKVALEDDRVAIPEENVYYEMFSVPSGSIDADYDLEESLKTMVEAYFPIVESVKNAEPHSYYRQSIDNLLEQKRPGIFNNIEAMPVDFNNKEFADPESDPHGYVHDRETEIRSATEGENVDLEVNPKVMQMILDSIFDSPRDSYTHEENTFAVGTFLFRKLGRLGLMVNMHTFKDREESSNGKLTDDFLTSSSGTNAVGILPGEYWGTPNDRPIIVGAHWDTVSTSPGYNDNGSGASALLEIASTLARAKCYKNKHSIIFVAFDAEEVGCHGSLEFIRSFLIPGFVDKGLRVQGAYILDTLLNWDDREETQEITDHWIEALPKVTDGIKANQNRGDFLALISRQYDEDAILASAFSQQFQKLGGKNGAQKKFRLEPFEISTMPLDRFPTTEEMLNHTFFWRSDHSRFWYYHDETQFRSFGAVLLSDTASYRGYMRTCYHKECDTGSNPKHRKSEGMQFLAKTAQAVVLAVAELAGGVESCDLSKIYGYDDSASHDVTPQIALVSTEQTTTVSSTEQSTVQMFYTTETTSTTVSTEQTQPPQMLNSTEQSLVPGHLDDDDQNEILVQSHPKLEFNKIEPHSKPEFNKINMPVFDENDSLDEPEKEQDLSSMVSTNVLQNLITNFLSKVPRRFWYSAEPEKPSKSVDVVKAAQNNNNIYDDSYYRDQVAVPSEIERYGATGDSYEEGSDTGEEIEMEQPHLNELPEQPKPAIVNNYNGPYQPNYGNQYNIGHLTLAMDPRELMPQKEKNGNYRRRNNDRNVPRRRQQILQRNQTRNYFGGNQQQNYFSEHQAPQKWASESDETVLKSGPRPSSFRDSKHVQGDNYNTYENMSESESDLQPQYTEGTSDSLLYMPAQADLTVKNSRYQNSAQQGQSDNEAGLPDMAGFYLHGLMNLMQEKSGNLKGQMLPTAQISRSGQPKQPAVVKNSPMVIKLKY